MADGSGRRAAGAGPRPTPRERLVDSAYALFSSRGTRAVGVDTVIDHAGVAKKTLYTHFASKDELILAFLDRRAEVWTRGWLQAEVRSRASTPAGRLLAVFDVFGEWFARPDFEGCSFVNVMLEVTERDSPVRRAGVDRLAEIREFLGELVAAAGVEDVDGVARQWHILMKGAIVAAGEGDVRAAARARELAELLLAHHGVDPAAGG